MTRPVALTKAEASSQLSAEVESWLSTAMEVINHQLKNFSPGLHRLVFDSAIGMKSLSVDARYRAIEEIISVYGVTGWQVVHTYGILPGEDDYFTFS